VRALTRRAPCGPEIYVNRDGVTAAFAPQRFGIGTLATTCC
jgi:hypothetical protein